MDLAYLVTPFVAWFVAGTLKFLINSIKARQWAFGLIGYGGLPSNHTAIVSSVMGLIAFREGFDHPAFGVSAALTFIVMLDASSLRKQVGRQAQLLNQLAAQAGITSTLRERMGHSWLELGAGCVVGVLVAVAIAGFGLAI